MTATDFKQAETVLLTGASGFIATHIVAQLFEKGYNIIGTVRSVQKGEYLVDRYPGFKYEVVDLKSDSAFDEVFKKYPEIKYVIHTASPANFEENNEDLKERFVFPAVNGVKTILYAAHNIGHNVAKVVLTSSVAAAFDGFFGVDTLVPVSEETWNNKKIEEAKSTNDAYVISKAESERYFWKFAETEKPKFKQASILLPLGMGPPIHEGVTFDNVNASVSILKSIFDLPSDTKVIPGGYAGHVDVRDVARLHILAVTSSKFDGERSLIYSGLNSNQQLVDIIHKFRPEESKNIPVGTPGHFDPKEEIALYDNHKTRERIDYELIPTAKTVIDQFDVLYKLYQAKK